MTPSGSTDWRRGDFSSGTPWEPKVGYARAVRVGRIVAVSGTTATLPDGSIAAEGDAYGQTLQALNNLARALAGVGARPEDVVRTRIFLTHIEDWEAVGRAHAERFGPIRPACTMVEVSRLIDRRLLVEIEADAVIADQAP